MKLIQVSCTQTVFIMVLSQRAADHEVTTCFSVPTWQLNQEKIACQSPSHLHLFYIHGDADPSESYWLKKAQQTSIYPALYVRSREASAPGIRNPDILSWWWQCNSCRLCCIILALVCLFHSLSLCLRYTINNRVKAM